MSSVRSLLLTPFRYPSVSRRQTPAAHSGQPIPRGMLSPRIVVRALLMLATLVAFGSKAEAQDDLEEAEERAMRAAVQRVASSVVRIETLGGLEVVGGQLANTGPTTGLIVGEDGWVLSSAFNFAQQPSSILVTLPNGKRAAAEIAARDLSRMLVLLKLNTTEKLPVPMIMPREEITVGQWSIAVGRTFDQPEPNSSVGIISATNRVWGKAIQTDAKISPSNYGGPLVDIRGRVMGILVPLSPSPAGEQAETAGAELYDSGIGFAIPLADVMKRIDRLKQRENLYPGKLGVSLKGQDNNSDEAIIGYVQVKGPASAVGLKVDDKIVELAGSKVARLGELRLALGRYYAGEKLKLVAQRGEQRIETELELAAKIDPYQNPFLGILPQRTVSDRPGVVVRYVYPGSGAEKAGIQVNDRLLALGDKPATDLATIHNLLAGYEPGQKIKLEIQRGEKNQTVEVTPTALPTALPATIPTAHPAGAATGDKPALGVVPIKLPEETNECIAYVPENYDPRTNYSLVVWLHAPGGYEQQELVNRWKSLCEEQDLILLAPKSADPSRWQATELEFIRKVMEEVVGRYRIDRARVVAHGFEGGGALAYALGFGRRELVRAVAAVDAPMPLRTPPPENDPLQRLSFFITQADGSKLTAPIQATVKKLEEMKYSVQLKKLPAARYLNAEELKELASWINTLDRI
ncbi:MAG: PDZ domain-containing protein [Planctomycetota bacterium]